MKKFLKAIGGAALCFAVYFALQIAVTAVAVFFEMMVLLLESGVESVLDPAWEEGLINRIYVHANEISAISNLVYLAVLALFYALEHKKISKALQLRACTPMMLGMSVVYGFGVCFVVGTLTDLIPFSEQLEEKFSSAYALLEQGSPIAAFLATVVMAPLTEEIVFRGLIHRKLRKGMPVWLAVVISSLVFGLMHGEVIWAVHAFMAGVALALIYEQTQSLWPCILVHFTNNLISQIISWTGDMQPWLNWTLTGLGAAALAVSVVYLVRNKTPEPVEEPPVLRSPESAAALPGRIPGWGPTVLILGDSVRMGYAPVVRRLLMRVASVVYPLENCRDTQFTYVSLAKWRRLVCNPDSVRVVYWNNGHWDAAHWDNDAEPLNDPDAYSRMLVRIADKLRSQYPNAQIVFATTTPMNPVASEGPNPRTTEEIRTYNAAAVSVLQNRGVIIDDLFAKMEDKPASLYADYCHLSAEGCEYLGAHAAETIWRLLEKPTEKAEPEQRPEVQQETQPEPDLTDNP